MATRSAPTARTTERQGIVRPLIGYALVGTALGVWSLGQVFDWLQHPVTAGKLAAGYGRRLTERAGVRKAVVIRDVPEEEIIDVEFVEETDAEYNPFE